MKIKLANLRLKIVSDKGFTLIEILIVIAVIASLAAISITTFGDYSKSQTFNQAHSDFLNVLNTAKSRAISQDNLCAAGTVLNGYSITLDKAASPNTYSLNVFCSNTSAVVSGYSQLPLPSGITFGGTLDSVFFPVLNGGAILNDGSLASGTIILVQGSSTKTITIDGATVGIQ